MRNPANDAQSIHVRQPHHRAAHHCPRLSAGHTFVRFPKDLQMVGYILDAEHVQHVGTLIRETRSHEAIALLSTWRRLLPRFQFVVIGGHMHQRAGGVVGGLSTDWNGARTLFDYASNRFDQLAVERGSDFCFAWFALLTAERNDQFSALFAQRQQVGGHA